LFLAFTRSVTPLAAQIRSFGENLFYPPNVKGWPGGENWINTSTLLARKQFIEQLFRETEARDMHSMTTTPGTTGSMANTSPTQRPRAGLRLDLNACSRNTIRHPMRARTWNLSTQLQLQRAVPAVSPVDAINADITSSAYLRAWVMDPAYQLK
jgi:Protein of unknown function (DUF1800)